jgi:glycosyltransferase involved in cell wall biosynthesis
MAKVDVVVPCYNYGRFLAACVHSVLNQSVRDCRVLIVDDASSDDSVAVANRLAEADRRISVIAHARNRGHIQTYNEGIDRVSGEYFVLLSADDLLTPGQLERSLSLLDHDRTLGFVYGRPRHFGGDVPPKPRLGKPQWAVWPGLEWLEIRYRKAVNCISQPEAIIRTSALHQAGAYYSEALPHTADLELWLRLAAVAAVGRVGGVDQGYYRVHRNSMQRTINAGSLKDLIGRRAAFINALPAIGTDAALRERLETMVRRKLAAQALDCACRAYDRRCTDAEPVDPLVEFAAATFAGYAALPEWKGLERRRRRGLRSRWSPRSLVASAIRRGRLEAARARWVRTGL